MGQVKSELAWDAIEAAKAEDAGVAERTALDQSFIDLCERHNLASAEVTFMRADHGQWFHGSIQWLDQGCESGRNIATYNGDSFADALNGAVAKMLTMRAVTPIPTDGLELAA